MQHGLSKESEYPLPQISLQILPFAQSVFLFAGCSRGFGQQERRDMLFQFDQEGCKQ